MFNMNEWMNEWMNEYVVCVWDGNMQSWESNNTLCWCHRRHNGRFSGALDVAATDAVTDKAICVAAAAVDDDVYEVAWADATVDVDVPRILSYNYKNVYNAEVVGVIR